MNFKKVKFILILCAAICLLTGCTQMKKNTIKSLAPPESFGSMLDCSLICDYAYYELNYDKGAESVEISIEKMENGVQTIEKVVSLQNDVARENLNCISYNFDASNGKIVSFNITSNDAITQFELKEKYSLSDKRFYNSLGSSEKNLETGIKLPIMYLAFDKDDASEKSANIMDEADKYEELFIFYISLKPTKSTT